MSRYYDFFCPVKLMAGEQALELVNPDQPDIRLQAPIL